MQELGVMDLFTVDQGLGAAHAHDAGGQGTRLDDRGSPVGKDSQRCINGCLQK